MSFRSRLLLGALLPLLSGVLVLPLARAQTAIVSSSNREILLEVGFRGWRTDTLHFGEETFQLVYPEETDLSAPPGHPLIPQRTLLLAIPPEAEPSVTVEEIALEAERAGVVLAPQPRGGRSVEGLGPIASYARDAETYTRQAWYPEDWIVHREVGRVRQQQVLRLSVAALRYQPAKGRLQLARKLRIRVDLGSLGEQEKGNAPNDPLIARLVLNPEQAARWQIPRPPSALRKQASPLSQGPWYKLLVRKEGIYKLDGQTLQKAGVDISSIHIPTLRIYNNGGKELPRSLSDPRPDSLIENAILVVDGGDGRFDPGDYILFYGRGVSGWQYDSSSRKWQHYVNHYTYDNIYWLTWGGTAPGRRMRLIPSANDLPGVSPRQTYRERVFLEEEIVNPLHSGIEWLGREFVQTPPTGRSRDFSLDLSGAVSQDTAIVRVQVGAYVTAIHTFSVQLNGYPLGQTSFYTSSGEFSLSVVRKLIEAAMPGIVRDGTNTLTVSYSSSSEVGSGYLDWYELEYTRRLEARNNELLFTLPPQSPAVAAKVSGFTTQAVRLFDVSRFWDVREIVGLAWQGNSFTFVDTSSGLPEGKTYLAVAPDRYLNVERIVKDKPSNLRSGPRDVDLIIVTHEDFESQALQLQSLHRNWLDERLATEVVLVGDIFDEFSWGLLDPTAIRDFLRFAYENWGQPRFVLFFGDGDYDFKNLEATDQNWLPPYESPEQEEELSRTTDDWFVCVAGNDQLMDMAVGRIPVRSAEEAQQAVDKLIRYATEPVFGTWKNTLTMVADDELVARGEGNETIHTADGENIAENYFPSVFHVEKIYLTEYPAVRTAAYSGIAKPKATEALLERINSGTLVLNFIGHGAPHLWTHERLLLASRDFDKIQNDGRLSFWIAATCDFGRFDHPKEQSLSEQLVVAKNRGAVGVLSSTRLAYASENANFNRRFLRHLFEPYAATGKTACLGEALMWAKLAGISSVNDQKYNLLGDPALRLSAPALSVEIDSVRPDTIRALTRMTVSGVVRTRTGEIVDRPDGRVVVTVYDSRKLRKYRTEAGSLIQYYLPGNTVFRGSVRPQNGRFRVSFFVPKDITYGGTMGSVEAYYWDAVRDGSGSRRGIPVGGTAAGLADDEGPVIRVYRENRELLPGDLVTEGDLVRVEIADSLSGVNLTGDIGHKITIAFDDDPNTLQDVTDRFQYYEGSYVAGALEFALQGLPLGDHVLLVKAWDNSNNSTTYRLPFRLVQKGKLALRDVLNYPNPFSDRTDFTFFLNGEAWVRVRIFTLAGRMIYESEPQYCSGGFHWLPWDGRDADGQPVANGLYLYQVSAQNGQGEKAEAMGKLVVAR
ncbi:MAG: type IX secretion system sortase PorU [candidate division KSB1 bacterium]|nr:type IX secretion system sortase PorU [candidate division KSB1 bacterium]